MKPLSIFILLCLSISVLWYGYECMTDSKPCQHFTEPTKIDYIEGIASYYSTGFHGRITASGAVYDSMAYTCAHKTLAFGTRLVIENTDNGKKVEVVVTDRGPFVPGRIVDLSYRAAEEIGMIRAGVQDVNLYTVSLNTK